MRILVVIRSVDGHSITYIIVVAASIAPCIIRWVLWVDDWAESSVECAFLMHMVHPVQHSLYHIRIVVLKAKCRRTIVPLMNIVPSRRIIPLLLLKLFAEAERLSGWRCVLGSDGRDSIGGPSIWKTALEVSSSWVHFEWWVDLDWVRWELGHSDGKSDAVNSSKPKGASSFR